MLKSNATLQKINEASTEGILKKLDAKEAGGSNARCIAAGWELV